jgi:hypothetical protein
MKMIFSKLSTKYILVIAAAAALLLVVSYLASNKLNFFGKASIANGVLTLPASSTVNTGDQFDVPIMVSSPDNSLSGIDIIVGFDKGLLQLVDITPHPDSSTLQNFLPATNNQFDKARVIQEANDSGQIKFGAFSYDARFRGDMGPANPLAVLRFQAKNTGQTQLGFVSSGGATNDSNLVDSEGIDTLGSTNGMTLTVNEGQGGRLGDANGDGAVDSLDFGLVVEYYEQTGPNILGDVNHDGVVDVLDFGLVVEHYDR